MTSVISSDIQSSDHSIMQNRSERLDFHAFSRRMNPIGQKNHRYKSVNIAPNRSSRKSGMPDTVCREQCSAGRIFSRWTIKPRCASRSFPALKKQKKRVPTENAVRRMSVIRIQHLRHQAINILRISEQPRMSRNSSEHIRIFIMHDTSEDTLPQ